MAGDQVQRTSTMSNLVFSLNTTQTGANTAYNYSAVLDTGATLNVLVSFYFLFFCFVLFYFIYYIKFYYIKIYFILLCFIIFYKILLHFITEFFSFFF